MRQFKIIVEKHPDGYVAYPLGIKGVVVGEGNTYEEALSDIKSAIKFHVDTFGADVLEADPPVLEAPHLTKSYKNKIINAENDMYTGGDFEG